MYVGVVRHDRSLVEVRMLGARSVRSMTVLARRLTSIVHNSL